PRLAATLRDAEGDFSSDARSVDAARLAIAADADPPIVDAAARAAARFLHDVRHNARQAHELTRDALGSVQQRGGVPSAGLLFVGVDAAERLGEMDALKKYMTAAEALAEETNAAAGSLLLRKARLARREGRLDDALQDAQGAAQVFATFDL